ncbi:MAG: heme ABC transporter permease [Pseudomonadota bacterium]
MFSFFSNPARFEALSRTLRPWLFVGALVAMAAGLYLGLVVSPADAKQGDSVRIMYIHVPAAWMALGAYTMITVASVVAFIWRHSLADRAALAAAPFGLAMTVLALITGAVWGKPTWGAWWVWDARLTSVLVLMFIYLGYMSVWQAIDDKARAARFARIIAMVGFINIPIIKFSVDWWNTLHQPASIIRASGPTIDAAILTPLLVMIIAYTLLFAWFVLTGVESQIIEARLQRQPSRAVSTASPVEPMTPTPEGSHG